MASTIDLPSIKRQSWTIKTTYTLSQIISYNLALGAPGSSLPLVFESHPDFHALPTFGTVPTIAVMGLVHRAMADFLPQFQGHNHVHGEHYLRLVKPYPIPKGTESVALTTTARVVDIVARKTGVLVCVDIISSILETGDVVCENEWSGFVMRVPSEGANATQESRGARTTLYPTPSRAPDKVLSQQTTPEQAALYRAASGDLNPLHIDPETSKSAGFAAPLLTGTCTLGMGVRHVIEAFADGNAERFESVKCRLSKPVFATLKEKVETEMWSEGRNRVLFRMTVGQNDGKKKVVISQGCVRLKDQAARL